MATSAFSYFPQNDTDLNFNTWVDRFLTALSDVGLTQTADTGQTTFLGSPLVAAPGGIDTSAGFQIWTTPSLAGSPEDRLYLKFGFGTGNQSSKPGVFLQVGTGSDGAGTLTGPVSDNFECYPTANISGASAGPCYFAAGDWGFWFAWGIEGLAASEVSYDAAIVLRSVDATGAADSNGYLITSPFAISSTAVSMELNPQFQCGNVNNNKMWGNTSVSGAGSGIVGPFSLLPCPDGNGSEQPIGTTADDNGDAAIFPIFGINPHPFPTAGAVGWQTDLPTYSTFSATPVGTTQRNYISMLPESITVYAGVCVDETFSSSTRYALPWE